MNKGKVIEVQKKYAIVLNEQMAYIKIKKKNGLTVGNEIYYFEEDLYKESKQPVKKYFLVAAVLFMMLFIQPLLVAEEAYGYISVDINPSIELEVNKSLEVLSIEAINDDAKIIIKDDWIGKSAKDVIDLFIEETKSKGILNSERDFVLVSYYFDDEDSSTDQVFIQSLDELFNEKPHDYEVAVIKSDEETYSEAKKSKESLGQQVVNQKMDKQVEDLLTAKESIKQDEDFKVYKKDANGKSESDEKDNKSKGVLGRKSAETIAFETIGGKGEILDFDFDRDDDEAEYNFEIALDDKIHEIRINGFTGEIIEYESESKNRDDNDNEKSKPSKGVIGRKSAETIAFERIGDAGKILEFDFERDGDEAEYDFEIAADNKTYKIKIDGFTGEIIQYETDTEDHDDSEDEKYQSSRGVLGRKAAEEIIFEVIGGEGKIIDYDFDRDDDEAEYEFEVELDGKIHEIKIDGFTGEIIEHEVDEQDENADEEESDKKNNDDSSEDIIDKKTAESIVFNAIGGEGRIIYYELDQEDDEAEYEFEVELDGKIHEITIDGFTGEVIGYEVDEIDDEVQEEYKNNVDEISNQEENIEGVIGRNAAEEIAFKTIGSEGEILDFEFDEDDEELEYFFEIQVDDKIYEITINGFTGQVLEHEIDTIDDEVQDKDSFGETYNQDKNIEGVIGRNAAEAIAFKTIGSEGEILDFEFDEDDDKPEYFFEISANGNIYEIKIDGSNGSILQYDIEIDD